MVENRVNGRDEKEEEKPYNDDDDFNVVDDIEINWQPRHIENVSPEGSHEALSFTLHTPRARTPDHWSFSVASDSENEVDDIQEYIEFMSSVDEPNLASIASSITQPRPPLNGTVVDPEFDFFVGSNHFNCCI